MDRDSDESTSIGTAVELQNMAEYGSRNGCDYELDRLPLENDFDASGEGVTDETKADHEAEAGGPLWKKLVNKFRKKKKEDGAKDRDEWDNKAQFLLTLIGYAVGLGNVWRFSYLCAKNGGGAFLLPYLVMLFLVGIPLFYLELLLGQSLRRGPINAWRKLVPNLSGLGVASIVVTVYISLYYNVIIGWVLFYFVNSFHLPLLWAKCFGYEVEDGNFTVVLNETGVDNYTLSQCWEKPTQYYWYKTALEASESINHAETFNWKMFLSLFVAWFIIYLCLFRGIKSSGKVVYFTATFPYLVLVCLFFRAVTLEGAGEGIKFLFLPGADKVAEKLFSPQVWLEAATQIFFSLGVAVGSLIALSSYTKPHNNALLDSFIVCLTNSFTSIFAGIVVFSIIGFKASETGESIELVAQGPGLAFVVFTEALIHMPLAPLWAVLFFIMLMLLGLDSQFATLEGLITVLMDNKTIGKIRKEIVVGIICIVMFLLSIPFILGNGIYLFQLFDQFTATIPLLFVGLVEFVAIGWVVGVEKFLHDIAKVHPHRYLRWLWTALWMFINPIVMTVIFLGSIISEIVDPLEYTAFKNNEEVDVEYPPWANFVGAVIVLSSILCIPSFLIGRLILLKEARQQAREFLREKANQFQSAYSKTKRFLSSRFHQTQRYIRHRQDESLYQHDTENPQTNTHSDEDEK